METDSYSANQRRAINLVWTACGDYQFEPQFLALKADGTPDFYMNCVIGLVRKWLGDEMPRRLFALWADDTRRSAFDDLAWLALENAQLADFVRSLEDGLDTVIGERGIGLSEGQAQRVAIARALLSKAPILLLDESTSALDEETEAKVLENISSLKDKTCLIVTHRSAAIRICDYRIHIETGKVSVYQI